MTMRERFEPMDPHPIEPHSCDYCGAKIPPLRAYCSPACRTAYNNLLARQGKAVIQMLKIWRKHRGGKGTPAEGLMSKIAARVDVILAEDRGRKAAMRRAEGGER